MKKIILLAFCFLVLFSLPLLALQTDPENPIFEFNEATVAAILAAGGIGLAYIANLIKVFLRLSPKVAVILALVLSVGTTAIVLFLAHSFGIIPFLIYSAAVFGEMTGWYKLGPGFKAMNAKRLVR